MPYLLSLFHFLFVIELKGPRASNKWISVNLTNLYESIKYEQLSYFVLVCHLFDIRYLPRQ